MAFGSIGLSFEDALPGPVVFVNAVTAESRFFGSGGRFRETPWAKSQGDEVR